MQMWGRLEAAPQKGVGGEGGIPCEVSTHCEWGGYNALMLTSCPWTLEVQK